MKKTLSLLLTLCLAVSLFGGILTAQAAEAENEAVFAARAIGIMTGDENGNMNLSSYVTRAEFAKMMVAASRYKDNVGTSVGVSLYKDVKSDHWASQYIKIAVEEGWFQGYVDGTFRPSGNITLEEGATVVLRALGFGSGDLIGAFPAAQLSKYSALGLGDGIAKTQGQLLSRQDCAQLFYNMMGTKNKADVYYGTTLGYTVTNGKINYSALVNANMKGPYLAEAGGAGIPITNPTVTKNGKSISLSQIAKHDVYYYNLGMRTVWVYDNKAVGTISAVSPNTAAPESVTVAGQTYALSTSEAQYAVSDIGSYKKGDTVTLMLDKNGAAAYISGAESVSGVFYGVVLSSERQAITIDGSASSVYALRVACTDGAERTVNAKNSYAGVGSMVMVTYEKGEASISSLSRRGLSGKFTATTFAGKTLSSDVKIMDIYETNYAIIYPDRLKGSSLSTDAVLYYELNGSGEIEHLILDNATGDAGSYAFMTSFEEKTDANGNTLGSSYSYYLNGSLQTVTTQGVYRGAKYGAVALCTKDGALDHFTELRATGASNVNLFQAVTSNKTYLLAENVQVYLQRDNTYTLVSVSDVLDSSKFSYTVYTDDAKAGSRVRIISVREKQ